MRHAQRGQALLESIFALVIVMMVAVWSSAQWNDQIRRAHVSAMASWLLELRQALNQDGSLVHSLTVTGDKGGASPLRSAEALIDRLKQDARLPASFSHTPPMGYSIELLPVPDPSCQPESCVRELLLLAVPDETQGSERAQGSAMDLLLLLDGKGASVLAPRDGSLRGATMQYPNPPAGRARLPLGTVALSVWKSDYLPPFVRLNETRAVELNGQVFLGGTVDIEQPAHLRNGVVLGSRAHAGAACATDGHLTRGADAGLVICEAGRWRALTKARRQFMPCMARPVPQGYLGFVFHTTILGDDGQRAGPDCECSAGYIARFLGRGVSVFEGMHVADGFVCESM